MRVMPLSQCCCYPFVSLSVCPSACLSVHPSVCLPVCPSVCLSVCPPVCLCLSVNLSVCLVSLQGDTLQEVASELRCILESGFFRFHFIDYVSGSVQLLYTPHLYQNTEEVMEMPSLSGMVVWTDEQISDFVRKLGFLDAEGDTEWLIRQFLHLNQVMNDRVVMWYRPPWE